MKEKGEIMDKRASNDRRVVVGLLAFALLYLVWPLDIMSGMVLDDIAVAAAMSIMAYRKSRTDEQIIDVD